jgi:hypothetical protein
MIAQDPTDTETTIPGHVVHTGETTYEQHKHIVQIVLIFAALFAVLTVSQCARDNARIDAPAHVYDVSEG